VVGAVLGLLRSWPDTAVGVVLGFGAGALVSAVSFELAREGLHAGGLTWTAVGLAAGAVTYFALDSALERRQEARQAEAGRGGSLALGAFLDGVPENLVLGLGLSRGEGVSLALLVAIYISNLPEALGSAADLERAGRTRRQILGTWTAVAVLTAFGAVAGDALADVAGGRHVAALNGFAAGALLVMLVSHVAPEATARSGRLAGLVTVLGFAVATGLATTG
jgi:ZIP family zinc transporter